MSFTHWLSNSLGLSPRPASRRKTPAARPTFRPRLEAMEDRWVPSTLIVNRSDDDVTQKHTLRYEVAHAQNGDTIRLTGHVEQTGITLTQGELVLTQQNLTIETKAGKPPVTISGGGISRIFEVAAGASVTLSNVTITGGNGLAGVLARPHEGRGGGILVDESSALTITGTTVSANSAARLGGGIADYGTLTVRGCMVSNNRALGTYGGGIAVFSGAPFSAPLSATLLVSDSTVSNNNAFQNGGGIAGVSSQLTVSNTTLSGNSTDVFNGGGINLNGGTLTLTGCTLSGNSAAGNGGAIFNFGTATISDCTLADNSASFNGGGVVNGDAGIATISGSTLSHNTATYSGGGIANYGTMTVAASAISDNSASAGGGIANYAFTGPGALTVSGTNMLHNTATDGGAIFNQTGSVSLTNCNLGNNVATSQGGGIYNIVGGTFAVSGGTLSGNSAAIGGGILNVGTMTVGDGCTLSGNTADYGGGIYNAYVITIDHCSLSNNTARIRGGAIYTNHGFDGGGSLTVTNSIFSANTPDNIFGPYTDGGGNTFH